jgi:hypothetical protein
MMSADDKESGSRVVCIVGMHRSGTSMVTRLLNLCGLELGYEQDLLGPDNGNPLGHFEHKGFKRLNEGLLAHFGGSTDNPPDLEPNWQHDPSLYAALEDAQFLLGPFKGKPVWGWKEPRTTLVIPFWKRLLDNTRFIVCIRNPLEVARSIAARDGMPVEKGLYLWNRYTRDAIRETEQSPRIFTFYEDYFANGLDEIKRVARFCGLILPIESCTLQKAIYRELRHQSYSIADLLNCEIVPSGYKALYIGLRALSLLATVRPQSDAPENAISKNIGAFLRSMDEFDQQEQLARSQELLLKTSSEVMELQSRLKVKDEQIARLVENNARLQHFSDAVRRTVVYRMYRKFIRPVNHQ